MTDGEGACCRRELSAAAARSEYRAWATFQPCGYCFLASSSPGTFFDLGIVHLLTTATIDRLRELYPEGRFEVRRFRPNVVVGATDGRTGFIENEWVGQTVAIGDEVRLRVTQPCPRCVMTTVAQDDLPKDPGILRTAARHNDVNVGVYATVERPGRIRRGDAVRLVSS